jgi:hypothetical protein
MIRSQAGQGRLVENGESAAFAAYAEIFGI